MRCSAILLFAVSWLVILNVSSTNADDYLITHKSGVGVTIDDVTSYVRSKNLLRSFDTPEATLTKRSAVRVAEQVLRQKLFSAQAADKGLISNEELRHLRDFAERKALLEAALDDSLDTSGIDWNVVAEEQYRANKHQFKTEAKVHARHILVKPKGSDWAVALQEILEIKERLLQGADFEDLAKALSDDPSAPTNGGDLGVFGRGQMFPTFESVAFSLDVGELSDVVVTPYGVHIIQLLERFDPEPIEFVKLKIALINQSKNQWIEERERKMLLDAFGESGELVSYDQGQIERFLDTLPD